jgi:hypothetical protein
MQIKTIIRYYFKPTKNAIYYRKKRETENKQSWQIYGEIGTFVHY